MFLKIVAILQDATVLDLLADAAAHSVNARSEEADLQTGGNRLSDDHASSRIGTAAQGCLGKPIH
jgi:hypothetical protein